MSRGPRRRGRNTIDRDIDIDKRVRALETGAHPTLARDGGSGQTMPRGSMTLLNGHTGNLYRRMRSDIVFLDGVVGNAAASSTYAARLYPHVYWPGENLHLVTIKSTGGDIVRVTIDANGIIRILDPGPVDFSNIAFPVG